LAPSVREGFLTISQAVVLGTSASTRIALDLEGLVESLGYRVLGVTRTHKEVVDLAKIKRPEPVFLIAKPFQPSTVSAVLS